MRCVSKFIAAAVLLSCALVFPAWPASVPIPVPSSPVVDQAGILDPSTRDQLLRIIGDVRERTTAEMAILIVRSTAPESIEDFSIAVFDRWKVGQRGKDNGLLFLVAVQDRRMRITTGYGLEGLLPDGKVGEIRDREIFPAFRAGRYSQGILQGTTALAAVLLGDAPSAGRTAPPRHSRQRGVTGILLIVFVGLVLVSIALSAMDRRTALGGRPYRRGGWWIGPGGWAGGGSSGWSGGGFSSGSFGGFGGGSSGGGGAGGSW